MKKIFKAKHFNFLCFFILFLLFLSNLFLSQLVLDLNITLSRLEKKTTVIANQNSSLRVKAAQLTSTAFLIKQAKKYGFSESKQIVYLVSRDILAKND